MKKYIVEQRDCFGKVQGQTEVWATSTNEALDKWKGMNNWYRYGGAGMPKISAYATA